MIITQEQLYTYQLKGILAPLHNEYLKDQQMFGEYDNFDNWLFENLDQLGNALYDNIGEFFGDADSAMSDLNTD